MPGVAGAGALATQAREAAGATLEKGLRIRAAPCPAGAAGAAPQPQEARLPLLHADVAFGLSPVFIGWSLRFAGGNKTARGLVRFAWAG